MEKEIDINTELRDIISHALLGENENISREGFNLVLQEVEKFVYQFADQQSKEFAKWVVNDMGIDYSHKNQHWYDLDDQIWSEDELLTEFLNRGRG